MSWLSRLILLFLLYSISFAQSYEDSNGTELLQETNSTENSNINVNQKREKLEAFIFKNALRDYSLGSYYEALDEFLQILKNPKSPFYKKSLLMLGKVYLQIAKRTGIKKYLWTADSYLNLYASKESELGWDYYYTKARVYETLEFYEKALAHYKRSLQKTENEEEQINSIIGILRVAVWLKKLDLVTKYTIVLNMTHLKKEQKKEVDFLKGMQLFVDEKYKEAFKYFLKTYREFESYLIDNPNYYYLVAETAYRKGDIKLAEQLFRRILNLIKNREVLKKVLLRMGDIGLKKGDIKTAVNYYYQLVSKYPKSKEAIVAKLKLISLMYRDEKFKKMFADFFEENEFIKNSEIFVVKTLVKNRTNYIGRYALANFGVITFKLNSDKLYERLSWELSLISSDRMDYEQKEYIRDLWSSYLLVLEPKRVCQLYLSNEKFFKNVFYQNVLIKIAQSLKKCKKESKRLALLKFILDKWNTDQNRFLLAEALYDSEDYENSMKVLDKIKKRDCRYYKFYGKNCLMSDKSDKKCLYMMRKSKEICKVTDFEAVILSKYSDILTNKEVPFDFLKRYSEKIAKNFEKNVIVQKFVKKYSEKLIENSNYRYLIKILEPIAQNLKNSCYINSLLAISYIRTGKMQYARDLIENIKKCDDLWAKIAINIYEAEKLGLRNENE